MNARCFFIIEIDEVKTCFDLYSSVEELSIDLNDKLPKENESFRFISGVGGFSSCSLVLYIAEKEIINNMYITTLRVGKKELDALCNLKDNGKLKNCFFALSGINKRTYYKDKRYEYDTYFEDLCEEYNFKFNYVNNHSKIILIETKNNKYVVETSSNFNENPKIEQFCLLNSQKVFDYYYKILKKEGIIFEGAKFN